MQTPPREPGCDLTAEGRQTEQQAIHGDRGAQAQTEAQAERRRCGLEGHGIFTARAGGEQRAEAGAELATESVVVEPREVQEGAGAIVFKPGDGLGERLGSDDSLVGELEMGERGDGQAAEQVGGLLSGSERSMARVSACVAGLRGQAERGRRWGQWRRVV